MGNVLVRKLINWLFKANINDIMRVTGLLANLSSRVFQCCQKVSRLKPK